MVAWPLSFCIASEDTAEFVCSFQVFFFPASPGPPPAREGFRRRLGEGDFLIFTSDFRGSLMFSAPQVARARSKPAESMHRKPLMMRAMGKAAVTASGYNA